MKRFLSFFLCMTFVFAITGCGNSDDDGLLDNNKPTQVQVQGNILQNTNNISGGSNGASSLEELEMILKNNSFFTEAHVGSMSVAMKYWMLDEFGITDYSNIETGDIKKLTAQMNEAWFEAYEGESFRIIVGEKYPVQVNDYLNAYAGSVGAFGGNFSKEFIAELNETEEVWVVDTRKVYDNGDVWEEAADMSLEMTLLFLKISGEYYWCFIEMC